MKINQHKGFTLMELMMVVVVVAILAFIAIPSVGEYIRNQRIKSQMFDVLNTLNIARSEAVKRKVTTTICSSTDAVNCAGSTTWSTGYIVFEDIGDDGSFDVGSDTPITVSAQLTGSNTLMADANFITYQTDGSVLTTTTLAVCDNRVPAIDYGREITIQQVGRATLEGGIDESITTCTP